MGAVCGLTLDERVHVDGAFLVEVITQLGPVAARDLISDALGNIAIELRAIADFRCTLVDSGPDAGGLDDARLKAAGPAVAAPGSADVVRCCDRLSRIAWELGLTTLSGVAVDLGFCIERGDEVALSAVEARLQRVGRGSLCAAWAEATG